MVTSALRPLVPAYFKTVQDASRAANMGDTASRELFSKIEKVVQNCNRKFNSEKAAIIEKNIRIELNHQTQPKESFTPRPCVSARGNPQVRFFI